MKIYTRGYYSGTDYSASFQATLAVSDFQGAGGQLKYEVRDTANFDLSPPNWGFVQYFFPNPVTGSSDKDVTLQLKIASPGSANYQVRAQVEYEERGGLELK